MKKLLITIILMLTAFSVNAQWFPQISGTNQNLRDVEFLNRYTGWVVGDGGVIIKTINGGKDWINVPNPAVGKPLFKISLVDSNTAYVAGWFETIIKTTNGGLNWIEIQNGPWGGGDSYTSCHFLDTNYGFIVGQTQVVLKTTNGGLNFTGGYLNGTFYDVYFKSINVGLVIGSVITSYKTTDGGENWNLIQMPFNLQGSTFDKITVVNNQMCWVVGRGTRIVFFSNNFGDTWDTISNLPYISPTGWLFCCNFSGTLVGWVAGEYNRLFKTTNGGYNWMQENTGAGSWFWRDIFSYNDSVVWGVGGGGRIMHTTNGGQTLVNNNITFSNIPKDFKLHQNFPNPFNSETIINFELSKDGMTKLIVYDVLGREIKRLIDEHLPEGIHKVKFNIKDIHQKSSGSIYFYSLYFNNKLIDTKKLIYIP